MPRVLFAPGVTTDGLRPAGRTILAALAIVAEQIGRDLTVTCTTGGHAPSDPHTKGGALDIRTRDQDVSAIVMMRAWLEKTLGAEFTVLFEAPLKPVAALVPIW